MSMTNLRFIATLLCLYSVLFTRAGFDIFIAISAIMLPIVGFAEGVERGRRK